MLIFSLPINDSEHRLNGAIDLKDVDHRLNGAKNHQKKKTEWLDFILILFFVLKDERLRSIYPKMITGH